MRTRRCVARNGAAVLHVVSQAPQRDICARTQHVHTGLRERGTRRACSGCSSSQKHLRVTAKTARARRCRPRDASGLRPPSADQYALPEVVCSLLTAPEKMPRSSPRGL